MACTTPAQLDEASRLQTRLLTDASRLVRPGGLLVYATCSIARRENRDVAAAFLAAQAGAFETVPPACDFGFAPLAPGPAPACGLALAPGVHDNDGFYVATFRRRPL
jgi:16S rRNA (cytosine967-C5)-methyltransferase